MENVFALADEFGPARVVHVYEPQLGLKATLVTDNVAAGPSIGGLRITPDVSTGMGTEETCRAWVKDEIGRAAGLPRELGGIPLDETGVTGRALFHAIEAALGWRDFELDGARASDEGASPVVDIPS